MQNGESIAWRFTPDEKRLSITLPQNFGGKTHEVCLLGGYTFAPEPIAQAAA